MRYPATPLADARQRYAAAAEMATPSTAWGTPRFLTKSRVVKVPATQNVAPVAMTYNSARYDVVEMWHRGPRIGTALHYSGPEGPIRYKRRRSGLRRKGSLRRGGSDETLKRTPAEPSQHSKAPPLVSVDDDDDVDTVISCEADVALTSEDEELDKIVDDHRKHEAASSGVIVAPEDLPKHSDPKTVESSYVDDVMSEFSSDFIPQNRSNPEEYTRDGPSGAQDSKRGDDASKPTTSNEGDRGTAQAAVEPSGDRKGNSFVASDTDMVDDSPDDAKNVSGPPTVDSDDTSSNLIHGEGAHSDEDVSELEEEGTVEAPHDNAVADGTPEKETDDVVRDHAGLSSGDNLSDDETESELGPLDESDHGYGSHTDLQISAEPADLTAVDEISTEPTHPTEPVAEMQQPDDGASDQGSDIGDQQSVHDVTTTATVSEDEEEKESVEPALAESQHEGLSDHDAQSEDSGHAHGQDTGSSPQRDHPLEHASEHSSESGSDPLNESDNEAEGRAVDPEFSAEPTDATTDPTATAPLDDLSAEPAGSSNQANDNSNGAPTDSKTEDGPTLDRQSGASHDDISDVAADADQATVSPCPPTDSTIDEHDIQPSERATEHDTTSLPPSLLPTQETLPHATPDTETAEPSPPSVDATTGDAGADVVSGGNAPEPSAPGADATTYGDAAKPSSPEAAVDGDGVKPTYPCDETTVASDGPSVKPFGPSHEATVSTDGDASKAIEPSRDASMAGEGVKPSHQTDALNSEAAPAEGVDDDGLDSSASDQPGETADEHSVDASSDDVNSEDSSLVDNSVEPTECAHGEEEVSGRPASGLELASSNEDEVGDEEESHDDSDDGEEQDLNGDGSKSGDAETLGTIPSDQESDYEMGNDVTTSDDDTLRDDGALSGLDGSLSGVEEEVKTAGETSEEAGAVEGGKTESSDLIHMPTELNEDDESSLEVSESVVYTAATDEEAQELEDPAKIQVTTSTTLIPAYEPFTSVTTTIREITVAEEGEAADSTNNDPPVTPSEGGGDAVTVEDDLASSSSGGGSTMQIHSGLSSEPMDSLDDDQASTQPPEEEEDDRRTDPLERPGEEERPVDEKTGLDVSGFSTSGDESEEEAAQVEEEEEDMPALISRTDDQNGDSPVDRRSSGGLLSSSSSATDSEEEPSLRPSATVENTPRTPDEEELPCDDVPPQQAEEEASGLSSSAEEEEEELDSLSDLDSEDSSNVTVIITRAEIFESSELVEDLVLTHSDSTGGVEEQRSAVCEFNVHDEDGNTLRERPVKVTTTTETHTSNNMKPPTIAIVTTQTLSKETKEERLRDAVACERTILVRVAPDERLLCPCCGEEMEEAEEDEEATRMRNVERLAEKWADGEVEATTISYVRQVTETTTTEQHESHHRHVHNHKFF